jgi:hypothetical protein
MAKLQQWIAATRAIRILAQRARKNGEQGTEPLYEIIEEKGLVPGHYAFGENGLRGWALNLYRVLKDGSVPSTLPGQLNIHLYVC